MSALPAVAGERTGVMDPEDFRPPEFTDESLALLFADRHRDDLRYVAKWSTWFRWDGKRWAADDTLLAFEKARLVCRESASACNHKKTASSIASAKTVAAVERLARCDRRLAATTDLWDQNPLLLNTPAGVFDLATGDLGPHRPSDHLTKITSVAATAGECPLFQNFLHRITGGDIDLQAFLQRMFGYAATGSTKEHALFFGHGDGANGKSVLLNTVMNIMGDYARAAPIETFTLSFGDRHPTELAGLRGARLVTATETEEGRQWAEARIKQLTGGDKIAARFMRQDFFEFTPAFKLIIAGNHRPGLRSVDAAIRRRFHLVPFSVTIPPVERDPDLPEKLKAEWPAILRWIIDGCLEWQAEGLRPPHAVTAATDAYLEQQDAMSAWLSESCALDDSARETAKTLFSSWSKWAHAAGVLPGKRTAFLDSLRKKGFEDRHTNIGTTFFGVSVNAELTGHQWSQ